MLLLGILLLTILTSFLCARNQQELDAQLTELREAYPKLRFYGMKADMENMTDVKEFANFSLKCLGSRCFGE